MDLKEVYILFYYILLTSQSKRNMAMMASTRDRPASSASKRSAPSENATGNSRRRSNAGRPISVSNGRQSSGSQEGPPVTSEQAFSPTLARPSPRPPSISTYSIDQFDHQPENTSVMDSESELPMAADIIIRQSQINSKSFRIQPSPKSVSRQT